MHHRRFKTLREVVVSLVGKIVSSIHLKGGSDDVLTCRHLEGNKYLALKYSKEKGNFDAFVFLHNKLNLKCSSGKRVK